jgi:hypothetical protein
MKLSPQVFRPGNNKLNGTVKTIIRISQTCGLPETKTIITSSFANILNTDSTRKYLLYNLSHRLYT